MKWEIHEEGKSQRAIEASQAEIVGIVNDLFEANRGEPIPSSATVGKFHYVWAVHEDGRDKIEVRKHGYFKRTSL